MGNLLYVVAVILVILWLIGFLGFQAGGIIHILLVIAIIAVLFNVISGGRRAWWLGKPITIQKPIHRMLK